MSGTAQRLIDGYDLIIFDLDGVVYLVDEPIPAAVAAAGRLYAEGKAVRYATNNASRSSAQVAQLLEGMGVEARPEEVLTSAAAAAAVLAGQLPPGAPVLVVGAEALWAEVAAVGLSPVAAADDRPVVVLQGYGRQVGWVQLAEAAVAIRAGARWVATNADRTLPSPRGPLPGNGALVAALRTALDREPDLIVGKPAPDLFTAAARQSGAARALVVGDRLDTDIAGAVRAGMDSLLVLTGVSTAADLLAADPAARPTYVAQGLAGLFAPAAVIRPVSAGAATSTVAGWQARVDGAGLVLTGAGSSTDALTVLCQLIWTTGSPDEIKAGSVAAREALFELGLVESDGSESKRPEAD